MQKTPKKNHRLKRHRRRKQQVGEKWPKLLFALMLLFRNIRFCARKESGTYFVILFVRAIFDHRFLLVDKVTKTMISLVFTNGHIISLLFAWLTPLFMPFYLLQPQFFSVSMCRLQASSIGYDTKISHHCSVVLFMDLTASNRIKHKHKQFKTYVIAVKRETQIKPREMQTHPLTLTQAIES